MQPFVRMESVAAHLLLDNIDTDQIIPARFLKTLTSTGLGQHLFQDRPDAPLADAKARGAEILIAGANFGCGSSREHAPWAIHDFGFRAVIAASFADIFYANALKNGLLCVPVSAPMHAMLCSNTSNRVAIDLETCTVGLAGGPSEAFQVEPFARRCLLDGVDTLAYILRHNANITRYEETRPWTP